MIQEVSGRPARDFMVGANPKIAVREWAGDGATVLLLHGLSHNLEVWTPVADILPRENRILAIDLRGHGKSETSSGQAYADHAADVVAVLDALKVGTSVIAGHSWGARVALYLAAQCPERCRGVVAVDQALWDYEPPPLYLTDVDLNELESLHAAVLSGDAAAALKIESLEWGLVWASVLERSLEETAEGWVQRPIPNDVRALTVSEARSQPVEQLYAKVTAPTVMLFATNDDDFGFARPIGRQANVEYLRTTVSNAQIEWIEGDHSFFVENPAPVAAAIVSMLDRA